MNMRALLMHGKDYEMDAMPVRDKICWPAAKSNLNYHTHPAGVQTDDHCDEAELLAQLLAAGTVTRVR